MATLFSHRRRNAPYVSVVLVCVGLADACCPGGFQNEETRLHADLFQNYVRSVRPVKDPAKPVQVKLGIALASIQDVNIAAGSAKLNVWLRASWFDPQLDWNKSAYGGLSQTTAKVDKIWHPDFLAYNHIDKFEAHIRHKETGIYLYSDKSGVYWSRPAVIRISQKFDVTDFPFDTQDVSVRMGSWSLSGLMQNLSVMHYTTFDEGATDGKRKVTSGEIDMAPFTTNEEYEVVASPAVRSEFYYACCPTEPWPVIVFSMKLKRKPTYYVNNIITPVIATASVAFSGFFIPHDAVARVPLCITCILVLSAIMYVSSDILPVTDKKTLLGTLYIGSYFFSLISLLINILSVRLIFEKADIDDDGSKGSFFCGRVLGISPERAVETALKLDLYCAIGLPFAYLCFCTSVIMTTWSTAGKVLFVIAAFLTMIALVTLVLSLVYFLRKTLIGNEEGFLRDVATYVAGNIHVLRAEIINKFGPVTSWTAASRRPFANSDRTKKADPAKNPASVMDWLDIIDPDCKWAEIFQQSGICGEDLRDLKYEHLVEIAPGKTVSERLLLLREISEACKEVMDSKKNDAHRRRLKIWENLAVGETEAKKWAVRTDAALAADSILPKTTISQGA